MIKNNKPGFLAALYFLSAFTGCGGELPFEVGDTIGFVPARSDRMTIKTAVVKEISGRWFFVEARGGNSEWNCWYNSDQVQNLWIEKRAAKEEKK